MPVSIQNTVFAKTNKVTLVFNHLPKNYTMTGWELSVETILINDFYWSIDERK